MAAEHLCRAFPAAREGELARWLNRLVNSGACAEVARSIGLPDALRLDASAARIGARESERVLGDACEALIPGVGDGTWPAASGLCGGVRRGPAP